jgi:mersacidin/lichenicidin family type 2 lantibiotic
MSLVDVIKAWTDPRYRDTLSAEQLAAIPDNPAGVVELGDAQLSSVAGGMPCNLTTYGTSNSKGWRCLPGRV